MPVEGRHEHHERQVVAPLQQSPGHLEARQSRHLHVQEHDVRLGGVQRFQRRDAVGGLGHHLDVALVAELVAQLVARQFFVVHNQGAHRRLAFARRRAAHAGDPRRR